MKYLLLTLVLLGLMIPLACNNVTPVSTGSGGGGRNSQPTSTATNLNGYTSTPTATLQATPSYIGTISTGISAPNGLAYANSLIYVAEGDGAAVSQVQVLNAGTNAVNWTWTGSGSTLFQWPAGVAVNSAGTTAYVLDSGNSNTGAGAVYSLAPAATPTPIAAWTSYNGTPLSYPNGIALDSGGNVYVADSGNGMLEEFGPSGAVSASWSGDGTVVPVAVALDSGNNVYVADGGNAEVWVLSPSGSSFAVSANWYLPVNQAYQNGYWSFYGLAVDASKNVYVADYYNSQVQVYTNTGTLIGEFNGNQTGATPLAGPDALLLYNSNIYVGDYDSNSGTSGAGIVEIFGPNNY
jgi:DNA-binding beta-propeller fold protein YncE